MIGLRRLSLRRDVLARSGAGRGIERGGDARNERGGNPGQWRRSQQGHGFRLGRHGSERHAYGAMSLLAGSAVVRTVGPGRLRHCHQVCAVVCRLHSGSHAAGRMGRDIPIDRHPHGGHGAVGDKGDSEQESQQQPHGWEASADLAESNDFSPSDAPIYANVISRYFAWPPCEIRPPRLRLRPCRYGLDPLRHAAILGTRENPVEAS